MVEMLHWYLISTLLLYVPPSDHILLFFYLCFFFIVWQSNVRIVIADGDSKNLDFTLGDKAQMEKELELELIFIAFASKVSNILYVH